MLFATLTVVACRKEEQEVTVTTQEINMSLKQNEAYTFALPTGKCNYKITTDAAQASVSLISKDANGNNIYSYTPKLNYIGSDNVSLSNKKEGECHSEHHHPHLGLPKQHCNENEHHEKTINNINIHFVIADASSR